MTDLATLARLDALLAKVGCRLTDWQLFLTVGCKREALIGELVRLIVGQTVTVVPAPRAIRNAGECRDCGSPVLFVRSATSPTWIPTDRDLMQIVTDDGSVARGRTAHQATCPHRNARIQREMQAAHAKKGTDGEDAH